MTIDELNEVVANAINAALDAREVNKKTLLLSRKAVAKRLHVDVSTLWRWNRSGYLRAHKVGGKIWYYEESVAKLERGEISA